MSFFGRFTLHVSFILGVIAAPLASFGAASQARAGTGEAEMKASVRLDGRTGLHSLMALGDGHLQKLADALQLISTMDEVRTGDWQRIRGPLARVGSITVPAVLWFAEPNGAYSTLPQGRAEGSLADRPYFPRALAGQTVIGDLVVSRSARRNTAIVAVPLRSRDNQVVGVLGASVYLDSLGALIRDEMGGLEANLRFFAIDSTPIGALNSDPTLIFTEPMKLGDAGMKKAFAEIISHQEGVVTYTFQGRERTMLYRKSPVTGWWYAFGAVRN